MKFPNYKYAKHFQTGVIMKGNFSASKGRECSTIIIRKKLFNQLLFHLIQLLHSFRFNEIIYKTAQVDTGRNMS